MTQFTERAIESTFLSLLEEKPLNRITVMEISAACGVNRKTFYNHYDGLEALLDAAFLRSLQSAAQGADSWNEALCAIAQLLTQNRVRVLHVLAGAQQRFEAALCRAVERAVQVQMGRENICCPAAAEARLRTFYAAGFSGLLLGWIRDGMDANIMKELHATCALLSVSLAHALQNAADDD